MINSIQNCIDFIKNIDNPNDCSCVCGFDGFIDTIVRPVQNAEQNGQGRYFETIKSFGEYLAGKGGKSCSINLEVKRTRFGGNAPILSSALAGFGAKVYCVGALGYPSEDEIFSLMHPNCEKISISKPGLCNALEFDDGKILLTQNSGIENISYEDIERSIGTDKLVDLIGNCHGMALVNWGEITLMHKLWQNILDRLNQLYLNQPKKPMLIDFADSSARSSEEINGVIELVGGFNKLFDVCVSVNLNEYQTLCRAVGIDDKCSRENAEQLFAKLNVKTFVIHTLKEAYFIQKDIFEEKSNMHVKKPVISTGGGDNFNAGLLFALVNRATPEVCLNFANATSAYFVSNGKSPELLDLVMFLENWKDSLQNI